MQFKSLSTAIDYFCDFVKHSHQNHDFNHVRRIHYGYPLGFTNVQYWEELGVIGNIATASIVTKERRISPALKISAINFADNLILTLKYNYASEMASNLRRTIVLHGGIGNQLFQWAYGHQLATQGFKVDFVFFNKPYKLAHTRDSLQKYVRNCEHGMFTTLNLSKNRLIRIIQDPTDSYNPFSILKNRLSKNLDNPFVIPDHNDSFAYYFGYYQNFSTVDKLKDILVPELLNSFNSEELSSTVNDLVGAEVIHIRRGDTLTLQNMGKVGVLSSKYYSRLPKKSTHRRIVVTDDIHGARCVLSEQDVDAFYGPNDLTVKETLCVMANASILYTANSSLSWWGGVLAKYQGSKVFIPDPYFRDFIPNPGDALSYPGFQKLPSDFILPLKQSK